MRKESVRTGIELLNVDVAFPASQELGETLAGRILRRWNKEGHFANPSSTLRGISLSLSSGDVLGVVGKNGAGKTTLLRVLSGVYPPTAGSRNISGRVANIVDLSLGLNYEETGRRNILARGLLTGYSRKSIATLEDEIIEFSGLRSVIDRPIRTYSSGMLLRLAFSVVTTLPAEILILDEWLTVGDQDFQTRADERLRALVKQAKIVVIASHNLELLSGICTLGLVLENGSARYQGSIQEALAHYRGERF